MNVLFMGGKRVGYGCLKYLIRLGHNVVGVAVNPGDTDAGRWYPSICELSLKYGIPVFEYENINSPGAVTRVQGMAPDIIVVVYFDAILKKQIISIPPKGCINLHLALAEEYRGCYPTTWAIINDEKRTGVTLHYIDESIDGGDIIAQREVKIERTDTGLTLYDKCTDACISLFMETFPAIAEGRVKPRPQDKTKGKYYKRQFPDQRIDFSKSGQEIYNHLRAVLFEPFPPPYFFIGNQKYEVRKVED